MFHKNRTRKQDINQELNIMPVLDILSTLVVFLLLTAVWYQVGSFKTEQAFDSQSKQNEIKATVIGTFTSANEVIIEIKDRKLQSAKIALQRSFQLQNPQAKTEILGYLKEIKSQFPEITDSIVIPTENSSYENVIFLMDQMNKTGIKNIGLGYRGT